MSKGSSDKLKDQLRSTNRRVQTLVQELSKERRIMATFPPPPVLLHAYLDLMNAVSNSAPEDVVKALQHRVRTMFETWIQRWVHAEAPSAPKEPECTQASTPSGSSSSSEPVSSSESAPESAESPVENAPPS